MVAAQGAAGTEAHHLDAVERVCVLQGGALQRVVVVVVGGRVAVGRLRDVQLGLDITLVVDADLGQGNRQKSDDSSTHTQHQVQDGLLSVPCA